MAKYNLLLKLLDTLGLGVNPASRELQREQANSLAAQAMLPTQCTSAPLKLWLRADSITGQLDASAVAQWPDDSGNANHATQGTGGSQPTLRVRALNNLPCVRFDGGDDYMSTAQSFSNVQESTVLLVLKSRVAPATTDTAYVPLGQDTDLIRIGGNPDHRAFEFCATGFSEGAGALRNGVVPHSFLYPSILCAQRSVPKNFIRTLQNGIENYRVTNTAFPASTLYTIGRRNPSSGFADYFDGDMFEVIAFHGLLSDHELRGVHAYLAEKYALHLRQPGQDDDQAQAPRFLAVTRPTPGTGQLLFTGGTGSIDVRGYEWATLQVRATVAGNTLLLRAGNQSQAGAGGGFASVALMYPNGIDSAAGPVSSFAVPGDNTYRLLEVPLRFTDIAFEINPGAGTGNLEGILTLHRKAPTLAATALLNAISGKLPATLGQKTSAQSLAAVLSSEQETILLSRASSTNVRESQVGIVNAILNPSLETASDIGSTNWQVSFTGSNTAPTLTRVQQADALDGAWFGRVAQGALGTGQITLGWGHRDTGNYKVIPGRRYVLEVGLRPLRALTNLFLRCEFYPTISSSVGSSVQVSPTIPTLSAGGWTRLRHEFIAPAGASIAALSMFVDAPNVVANMYEVDDVRFFEAQVVTAGQGEALRVDAAQHYLRAHQQGGNPNPYFREGTGGYISGYYGSGTNPTITTSRVIDGATGLPKLKAASAVTTTATTTPYVGYQYVAVQAEQRFKATARIERLGGVPTRAYLVVFGMDDAGGFISAPEGRRLRLGLSTGVPVTLDIDTVIPAGVTHLRLEVRVEYPTATTPADLFAVHELRFWLDGVEQRLDEISAKLPATLGPKASAQSLAAVLSTEQEALMAAIRNRFAPSVGNAVEVTASGDSIVHTPATGKRVRVKWVGLSTPPDLPAKTKVQIKFGPAGTPFYSWWMGAPGAFAHGVVREGAVDEKVYINSSAAPGASTPLLVNLDVEEF